jgi:hypothetical protein
MSTSRSKAHRDFEHTVRVVTARIHAGDTFTSRVPTQQFVFSLKAASSAIGTQLPRGEILAPGSQLGVSMVAQGNNLRITIQLKGFKALQAHRGKPGRLISEDGRVHVPFRFDEKGAATCLMTDSDISRGGLAHFRIELFDDA